MNRRLHQVLTGIGVAVLAVVALDMRLDRRETARRGR